MSTDNEQPLLPPDKRVFTVQEVAEILRVSKKTLYRAINTKCIPAIEVGTAKRIPRQVLLSLLEQGGVAPDGGIHAGKTRR